MKRKKQPVIPQRNLIALTDPKSSISESYRTLRTNIQFSSIDRTLKTLMVTSAGQEEGKSTTIANLAVVMAQDERRTLLIDADLRQPTVHHTFDLMNRYGLTTAISGNAPLIDVIQSSAISLLDVITSGPVPPNPAEMLGSQAMERIIEEAGTHYDQILFDTPPVIAVTDAQLLASKLDGVILVVHSGKTNQEFVLKAKEQLLNVNANIIGVVINNKQKQSDDYHYYYYGNEQ